jgi:hypothetical protein
MAVIRGSEYKEFELMGNHMLGLATRGAGGGALAWQDGPWCGDATALP